MCMGRLSQDGKLHESVCQHRRGIRQTAAGQCTVETCKLAPQDRLAQREHQSRHAATCVPMQETMRSNSARAPGYAGGYLALNSALVDSAFLASSQPSSATAPGDPATLPLQQEQQKSRYLFHTQDPWCALFLLLPAHTAASA